MGNHAGNFNEDDLRWLGGLIDSDGCFSISRSNRKNDKVVYTPSVTITNSSTLMVEHVHNLLVCFDINHHIKNNGSCKNIVISRPNIIKDLCNKLEDKVLVKAKELRLLSSFCDKRIKNVVDNGCNWKATYTEEEIKIVDDLGMLNLMHYGECVEFGIEDSLPKIEVLNNFSLSWLAGFIDGDGCLTINKIKRPDGSFQYQPMTHIVTGSPIAKNIISNFLDRYNINYYLKKQLPGKKHKPNCRNKKFEFYIRSHMDCKNISKLIENKLVGKQKRCKYLITFCDSRMLRTNKSYNNDELLLHDNIKKDIKDTSTTKCGTLISEDIV